MTAKQFAQQSSNFDSLSLIEKARLTREHASNFRAAVARFAEIDMHGIMRDLDAMRTIYGPRPRGR